MTEDPLEQEQTKIEVIRLNQEFLFMNPKRTTRQPNYDNTGIDAFTHHIVLRTPILPDLPIELTVFPYIEAPKALTITPFNPKLGYQITNDDFRVETRRIKLRKMSTSEFIDFSKAPLRIVARSWEEELMNLGFLLGEPQFNTLEFKPEIETLLQRLRLILIFPNSSMYESIPDTVDGVLDFSRFYPAEAPPLATTNEYPLNVKGFDLHLPTDLESISQIRTKFILVPKEPKNKPVAPLL